MGDMMEIELFAARMADTTHDQREAVYFLLKGMEIQRALDAKGGNADGSNVQRRRGVAG